MINHESIGTRSCDAEYYISNYFLTQLSYDSGYLERAMQIRGIYDSHNFDTSYLTDAQKDDRSGRVYTGGDGAKYRRYNFICPINNGLARDGKVLPPNIPYKFRFVRAKASRATLALDDFKYDNTVIPIIQPTLEVMYITSPEVDSKMNRLKGGSLSFTNYPIRQLMLNEGLHEYNLDLVQGEFGKQF